MSLLAELDLRSEGDEEVVDGFLNVGIAVRLRAADASGTAVLEELLRVDEAVLVDVLCENDKSELRERRVTVINRVRWMVVVVCRVIATLCIDG